jgi:hypothetical protein
MTPSRLLIMVNTVWAHQSIQTTEIMQRNLWRQSGPEWCLSMRCREQSQQFRLVELEGVDMEGRAACQGSGSLPISEPITSIDYDLIVE